MKSSQLQYFTRNIHDISNGVVFLPILAIGNPERHVRKASHCGSKQK